MGKYVDLTGRKYGKLTVVGRAYPNKKGVYWHCLCDCGSGKDVVLNTSTLNSGNTRSCGCLYIESIRNVGLANKKTNAHEDRGTYIKVFTEKNEPFYVDIDDYAKISDICWSKNAQGYIVSSDGLQLHCYIMDVPSGLLVDHIGGIESRSDCRRGNLRIATRAQNNMNQKPYRNNTSGVTGVNYHKATKKWVARIEVEGKRIGLGLFENKDDAIEARLKAEDEYFGEWSYNNSQKAYQEFLRQNPLD